MISQEHSLEAARQIAANELIVLDNGTVYALAGNANDPDLQVKIQHVKDPYGQDNRGVNQPVGWTVPFEYSLDTVDLSTVTEGRLRRLLADPHQLTGRIGALAFLRAVADQQSKRRRNIPDSIIPAVAGATVQPYSPVGNDGTNKVVRLAMALGAEPVMTSANFSGEPERVSEERAYQFAKRAGGLAVYVQCSEREKRFMKGSYPIVGVAEDHLTLEREGWLDAGILQALFYDVDFRPSTSQGQKPRTSKYPSGVLHLEDLPREYQTLKGNDLWFAVLATVRWHDELVSMAQAIPEMAPNFPRLSRSVVIQELMPQLHTELQ